HQLPAGRPHFILGRADCYGGRERPLHDDLVRGPERGAGDPRRAHRESFEEKVGRTDSTIAARFARESVANRSHADVAFEGAGVRETSREAPEVPRKPRKTG